MIDRDGLHQFVQGFRTNLDSGRAKLPADTCAHFPAGCCGVVSEALAEALRRRFGIVATYVCGARTDDRGTATHAWLEVGGFIIDITGDQFDQPAVVVTRSRTWHDGWPDQDRRPHIGPEIDQSWWAQFGWPTHNIGIGQ